MELGSLLLLAVLAAVVLFPLACEYADLRSTGLARTGALGTMLLLLPALAVAFALALPLAGEPAAQWVAMVLATVALYSAATRAILARASSAATAPSRRT